MVKGECFPPDIVFETNTRSSPPPNVPCYIHLLMHRYSRTLQILDTGLPHYLPYIDMFYIEDDIFERRVNEMIREGWQSPKP